VTGNRKHIKSRATGVIVAGKKKEEEENYVKSFLSDHEGLRLESRIKEAMVVGIIKKLDAMGKGRVSRRCVVV